MSKHETLLQKAQRLNIQPSEKPKERLIQKAERLGIKPQKKDGFIKSLVKSIAKPVVTLGARPFQVAKALGGATEEEQAINLPFFGKIETARTGKDFIKDVGRGIETVSLGLGSGAVKGIAGGAIRRGAVTGAKFGALGGFGAGLARKGEIGGAVKGAGIGAVAGGVLGGAIPVAGGAFRSVRRGVSKVSPEVQAGAGKAVSELKGFAGKIQKRGVVKAEQELAQKKLLRRGISDISIASKKLEKGRIVVDRQAREALKQGIPEADVALIKTSSRIDKTKMKKMIDIRESQLRNKRVTARSTDVVGDTFLKQAKFIQQKNRDAGKQLNIVARRLAGKKVDPTDAINSFVDDLQNAGVAVRPKPLIIKTMHGTSISYLDFVDSNFEDLSGAQKLIESVWKRGIKISGTRDALQLHRTKSFIDELVNYGKTAEGLSGKAQTMLKGFRRNIDIALDTKFPVYNRVNTVFAETIGELDRIGQAMGRKFKLSDTFANARAGTTMRRILSNTQSRSEILQLLERIQSVARKNGMKIEDDIITQANFADLLEKTLGSEAPTSFLGQIERGARGAQEIAGIGKTLQKDGVGPAIFKAGSVGLKKARGINEENQIKALRGLLNIKPKAFSRIK